MDNSCAFQEVVNRAATLGLRICPLCCAALLRLQYFKRLGERLQARKPAQPAAEVYVHCAILNRWTHLGMPVTVPCA